MLRRPAQKQRLQTLPPCVVPGVSPRDSYAAVEKQDAICIVERGIAGRRDMKQARFSSVFIGLNSHTRDAPGLLP